MHQLVGTHLALQQNASFGQSACLVALEQVFKGHCVWETICSRSQIFWRGQEQRWGNVEVMLYCKFPPLCSASWYVLLLAASWWEMVAEAVVYEKILRFSANNHFCMKDLSMCLITTWLERKNDGSALIRIRVTPIFGFWTIRSRKLVEFMCTSSNLKEMRWESVFNSLSRVPCNKNMQIWKRWRWQLETAM